MSEQDGRAIGCIWLFVAAALMWTAAAIMTYSWIYK
jgi:hypothetical protein